MKKFIFALVMLLSINFTVQSFETFDNDVGDQIEMVTAVDQAVTADIITFDIPITVSQSNQANEVTQETTTFNIIEAGSDSDMVTISRCLVNCDNYKANIIPKRLEPIFYRTGIGLIQ